MSCSIAISQYPFRSHLKDVAFTIRGWSIIDPLQDRPELDLITAQASSVTKYTAIISAFAKRPDTKSKLFHDPFMRSSAERSPPQLTDDSHQYLVVGYASGKPEAADYSHTDYEATTSDFPVGTCKFSSTERWNSPPVLVVTPVTEKSTRVCELFALLMPVNGLCIPYAIERERVWFRWEYRTSENSFTDRKSEWAVRVRDVVDTVLEFQAEAGNGDNDEEEQVDSGAEGSENEDNENEDEGGDERDAEDVDEAGDTDVEDDEDEESATERGAEESDEDGASDVEAACDARLASRWEVLAREMQDLAGEQRYESKQDRKVAALRITLLQSEVDHLKEEKANEISKSSTRDKLLDQREAIPRKRTDDLTHAQSTVIEEQAKLMRDQSVVQDVLKSLREQEKDFADREAKVKKDKCSLSRRRRSLGK